MFGSLSTTELIVILVIVILVFGVKRIPQLGKGLGEGIRYFKSALRDLPGEDLEDSKVPPTSLSSSGSKEDKR